jgi:murein DD-endopeptidase MepM/ murein hydrolase activator NlpD
MPHVRAVLRAIGVSRLVAGFALVVTLGLVVELYGVEKRRATLEREASWLRARLGDKRAQVARQREEMADVADAVGRLARTTVAVRERAAQARRLGHMEESRELVPDLAATRVAFDGALALVSEETARAIEQLAWLDGQVTAVGDSLAVLTAILKDPPAAQTPAALPSSWPVRGLVTSPFGRRPSPYDGDPEVHFGVDIQARYGVPVSAGGDGEVVFAGRDSGYGGLIVVAHAGDVDTFYAHLSAIYVREGQRVRRGQPIGAVGASGRATGAHLHYEVRVRGLPVDPRQYLTN